MKKFLFTSMILTLVLIMCLPMMAFGNNDINLTISSSGLVTWDKSSGTDHTTLLVYCGVQQAGDKRGEFLNYSSQSFDLKAHLDKNSSETASYEIIVAQYDKDGKNTGFGSASYRYVNDMEKLQVPANLRWDGTIAKWDAVKNATNYEISLKNGKGFSQIDDTTSNLEYDFTSKLRSNPDEKWYFTVVATNTGNYRDSYEAESPKYVAPKQINYFEFEDFVFPKAGQFFDTKDIKFRDPSFNGKITLANFIEINNGMTIALGKTDKAEKGETVELRIKVTLDDGYAFPKGGAQAYLNGKVQDSETAEPNGMVCTFKYNYTVPEETGITITEQSPTTVEYKEGEDVKLFVRAIGADSYQWNKIVNVSSTRPVYRPQAISGATSSEYVIKNADKSLDGAEYCCTIKSIVGTEETSNTYTLKLVEGGTTQTEQPTQTEEPTTKEYMIIAGVADSNDKDAGTVYLKTDKGTKDYSKGSSLNATDGTKVEVKAKANSGYKFDKWEFMIMSSGKTTDVKTAEYSFNATEKVSLVAYFSKVETTTEQPTQTEEPTKTEEPIKTEEPTQTEQPTTTEEKTWIKASEWAETELDKANQMQLIPNKLKYADLTANITRAEFAHVAVKLYEKLTGNKAIAVPNNPFIDTADEEVLKAYNLEITKGTSEVTFNPDDLITREQMATMMTRALTKAGIDTKVDLEKVNKFADDGEMHDWGKESIYYMSSIEIIKGVGNNTFNVLGNATREQALLISERSAEKFAK